MLHDDSIWLITADLGYGLWDDIRSMFKDRFMNVGSSEMTMMGAAIGLAMENKKPFVYSITPFAIYRPFEMIRNYIDHEQIPVTIVGGGRDRDYGYLGFSHWAEEDKDIMGCFKNLKSYWPETVPEMEDVVNNLIVDFKPTYINLKK